MKKIGDIIRKNTVLPNKENTQITQKENTNKHFFNKPQGSFSPERFKFKNPDFLLNMIIS